MVDGSQKISKKAIDNFGKALLAQKHQREASQQQLDLVNSGLKRLESINDENLSELDRLIMQAEILCEEGSLEAVCTEQDEKKFIYDFVDLTKEEKDSIVVPSFGEVLAIEIDEGASWNEYLKQVHKYAASTKLDLMKDPFDELLSATEKEEIQKRIKDDYTMRKANCDKYDYIIAAFCGLASGLVDSFFVGMPKDSKLGNWTDKKADRFVEKISKSIWNADKRTTAEGKPKKIPDSLQKCISYLEQRFKVNYDARYAKDLDVKDGVLSGMSSRNHHLKSLSHSPSIIGLVFSIIDQFTGKASFIDGGKIIRVVPKKNGKELQGATFHAKLFCGFANWLGHLLSDLVGSSSTRNVARGKTGRGSGLGIPFYELFQFCEFGSFDVNGERLSLAELSVKVFENGYDLRFGVTMAIPVVLNELMIRLLWTMKQRYYHKKTWLDSVPFGNQPELRRMLLIGHGTLCLVDGIDARIRAKGCLLSFALHLNVVAWARLGFSGALEIRTLYKENAIDLNAMDKDLETEWETLMKSDFHKKDTNQK